MGYKHLHQFLASFRLVSNFSLDEEKVAANEEIAVKFRIVTRPLRVTYKSFQVLRHLFYYSDRGRLFKLQTTRASMSLRNFDILDLRTRVVK